MRKKNKKYSPLQNILTFRDLSKVFIVLTFIATLIYFIVTISG